LRDFLSLYCFDYPRRPVAAAEFELIFIMEETISQSFAPNAAILAGRLLAIRPSMC
jgi:hypothetical protein